MSRGNLQGMEKIPKFLSIGSRIQQIRAKHGLSQKKFAEKIGISNTMLSELERGTAKPSMPVLLAIEYVYKHRKEWVLTGDEPIFIDTLHPPIMMPLTGYETPDRQLMIWVNRLIKIFEEGDKAKIEAIKAQLRALAPTEKSYSDDEELKKGAA